MNSSAPDLTVAIASMGRPCLIKTLRSLQVMQRPGAMRLEVVIADDSIDGAVPRLLEPGPAELIPELALRIIPVGSRNISLARNACLEAARGRLIAFIDDDEWVAENWLVRMLAAMEDYGADAVFGPVRPQYPEDTPDWLRQANPLYNDWGKRGRKVEVGRTSNALMRRQLVDEHTIRFKPELGRTGGEDTDFFHQMALHGAHMVVTNDAEVFEEVPASRLDPGYLRLRHLRAGQSYARFRLSNDGQRITRRLAFLLGAGVKAALGLGLGQALRPFDRARALRFHIRGWMNLGKLREFAGRPLPEVYAPPVAPPVAPPTGPVQD